MLHGQNYLNIFWTIVPIFLTVQHDQVFYNTNKPKPESLPEIDVHAREVVHVQQPVVDLDLFYYFWLMLLWILQNISVVIKLIKWDNAEWEETTDISAFV